MFKPSYLTVFALFNLNVFAQEFPMPTFEYYEATRLFDQSRIPTPADFEKDIVNSRYAITAISTEGDWIDFLVGSNLFSGGECSLDYKMPKEFRKNYWNKQGENRSATMWHICLDDSKTGEPNIWELNRRKTFLEWKELYDVEGTKTLSALGLLHSHSTKSSTIYPHAITAQGLELKIYVNSTLKNFDHCRLTAKKNLICERWFIDQDAPGGKRVAAYYLLKRE